MVFRDNQWIHEGGFTRSPEAAEQWRKKDRNRRDYIELEEVGI